MSTMRWETKGPVARNMALNPELREKVRLLPLGLSDRDERVTLYAKGFGDSGSSIYERVERAAVLRGYPLATVPLRSAAAMLRDIGLTPRTLLKIDIEGAEYGVVRELVASGAIRHVRRVVIEFHDVPGEPGGAATLKRLLTGAGMEVRVDGGGSSAVGLLRAERTVAAPGGPPVGQRS